MLDQRIRKALIMMGSLFFGWTLPFAETPALNPENVMDVAAASVATTSIANIRKEIAHRMRSGELKDRAWGVYLIGQYGLSEFGMALSDLLVPVPQELSQEAAFFYRIVLDSLIQLDVPVPSEKLMPHYKQFPDEALILLLKQPADHRGVLLSVLQEMTGGVRWMAVCNGLTAIKAPGLAAYLLGDLKVNVWVMVYDDPNFGGGMGGGGGSVCCGAPGSPDPAEFPPIARYELVDKIQESAVIVAAGRHPVYYIRHLGQPGVPYSGGYTRNGLYGNIDETRTEYLADLLSTPKADLSFTPRPSYRVLWQGVDDFRYEMDRIRNEVERSFEQLVSRLMVKSLLSVSEAQGVRLHLSWSIHDARRNPSVKLPHPENDPN